MGAWDDGLYDNDDALDEVSALLKTIDLEKSPAHLAAGLGLRLWLTPSAVSVRGEELVAILDAHADWVSRLPAEAQRRLAEFKSSPEAFADAPGSRSAELRAILGDSNDGPFVRELLAVPGAEAVAQELGDRCAARLDAALGESEDLYALSGPMGALGLLVELRDVGVRVNPPRVDGWLRSVERASAATQGDEEFWGDYVPKVRSALELIRQPA